MNVAAAETAWHGPTAVYARVSSADQEADLDRQVARVTVWATAEQIPVEKVVTEVGSALHGHRGKFLVLLRDPSVGRIVVVHRDRFCRFGSEYVEAALAAQCEGEDRDFVGGGHAFWPGTLDLAQVAAIVFHTASGTAFAPAAPRTKAVLVVPRLRVLMRMLSSV